MSLEQQRDAALAAIDRALRDPADAVYEDLAAAVRALVGLRGRLIAEKRGGSAEIEASLKRLNALMSLVVAAEYPLEGMRRERIETARRELRSLPL